MYEFFYCAVVFALSLYISSNGENCGSEKLIGAGTKTAVCLSTDDFVFTMLVVRMLLVDTRNNVDFFLRQ
jgi:hypothetical protein